MWGQWRDFSRSWRWRGNSKIKSTRTTQHDTQHIWCCHLQSFCSRGFRHSSLHCGTSCAQECRTSALRRAINTTSIRSQQRAESVYLSFRYSTYLGSEFQRLLFTRNTCRPLRRVGIASPLATTQETIIVYIVSCRNWNRDIDLYVFQFSLFLTLCTRLKCNDKAAGAGICISCSVDGFRCYLAGTPCVRWGPGKVKGGFGVKLLAKKLAVVYLWFTREQHRSAISRLPKYVGSRYNFTFRVLVCGRLCVYRHIRAPCVVACGRSSLPRCQDGAVARPASTPASLWRLGRTLPPAGQLRRPVVVRRWGYASAGGRWACAAAVAGGCTHWAK